MTKRSFVFARKLAAHMCEGYEVEDPLTSDPFTESETDCVKDRRIKDDWKKYNAEDDYKLTNEEFAGVYIAEEMANAG